MLTYQDFIAATDRAAFIAKAINEHMGSELYKTAVDADAYDKQRNTTIKAVTKVYNDTGKEPKRGNLGLASNWFSRFNMQRCAYLLGNGVSFNLREKRKNKSGELTSVDVIKEMLGADFDNRLFDWGYYALIHGLSFGFWNKNRLQVYPVTNYVPFWDETTGALRAGIHFWRLNADKPMMAECYTEEGYTVWHTRGRGAGMDLVTDDASPRPYIEIVQSTKADGVIGTEGGNYGNMPIIPMWGSYKRQSTLVGMRENIDAYDLIKSGFISTVKDTSKIYWLIENHNGMTRNEMDEFLRKLNEYHIANVDSTGFDGSTRNAMTPYTQDPPYQSTEACLDRLARDMYRDFGAVDTSSIPAGATNDQIESAYQPLDEEADQFEKEVIKAIQQILRLLGVEDTPQFKRNRVSNVKETVESIMLCANYLDAEAVTQLIPFLTVDMRDELLERRYASDGARFGAPGGDGANVNESTPAEADAE